MGPIYAMGGQPGATTCIDGRGVGQPARCATLTTVHASPAYRDHQISNAPPTFSESKPALAASRISHPRFLEVGRGVHLTRYRHGPLVVTTGLCGARRGEG